MYVPNKESQIRPYINDEVRLCSHFNIKDPKVSVSGLHFRDKEGSNHPKPGFLEGGPGEP